jgi:[methyl-Co(III) methanol-specific corrinoid protein]:coenzyme M methyltransferase
VMALRSRFGGARSILHICGDTSRLIDSMKKSGATGLSVDQCMDLSEVKKELDEEMALIGNVSPIGSLLFGSPEDVEKEAMACLHAGVDVLSPGCGLAPRTPTKNVRAMVGTVKGQQ